MPPKNKAQPVKEELAKVVGDLTESLQSAQRMLKDSGGEIALSRINRREYESTIKDLLGIRILALKLPDDASGRFDTIGQNQSLSPWIWRTISSRGRRSCERRCTGH